MGSSKLKIKNIVNFSWEHKYSHGEVGGRKMLYFIQQIYRKPSNSDHFLFR